MADMREQYIDRLGVLKNKRNKVIEYLDKAEELADIKKELFYKQEWIYTKILYTIVGVCLTLVSFVIYNKFIVNMI